MSLIFKASTCQTGGVWPLAYRWWQSLKRIKKVRGLRNEGIYCDFPGGAVVKNPPANAGDTGSSPGLGRSHMPQSN